MKWRKRQKKHTHKSWLFPCIYFFLLVMMTPMVCHTVSSLEDRPVTDGWPPPVDFLLPVCELCVLGVTLTGSTTDSPLGGAALRHGRRRAVITPYNTRNHHCSLRSPLADLLNPLRLCARSYTQLCSNLWYFLQLLNNTNTHTHIQMLSPVDVIHITCQVKYTTLCLSTPSHEWQVFIVS